MTATAATKTDAISINIRTCEGPVLFATGGETLSIAAGTSIEFGGRVFDFEYQTPVAVDDLTPGKDYAVGINALGDPFATPVNGNPLDGQFFAGFHFAPGGNAADRKGGDAAPTINPHSFWDIDYRPSCPDPRGMVRVIADGIFWVDIYLLGVDHSQHGTSRFGVTPATGRTLDVLDYAAANSIIEGHGKRLLTYDEFRTAAHGVTERSGADTRPSMTGLDAARTSRFGLMQATGNLWVWGTDGDPDNLRPSIFGGSWLSGELAGSRYALLDDWPGGLERGPRGARRERPPDTCLTCAKARVTFSLSIRIITMTATAEIISTTLAVTRPAPSAPILAATGRSGIVIKAGTIMVSEGHPYRFDTDTPVPLGELIPGRDYGVGISANGGGVFTQVLDADPVVSGFFAGFHFAPGGNATAREGGDVTPAINPYSIWDIGFRPACADPRGMALVEVMGGKLVWVDIYLLDADHQEQGTSRARAIIADGRDLPMKLDGQSRYSRLDYATAVEIYACHGKRLLGAEEFFAAAYGVKERTSRSEEPTVTGSLDDNASSFISKWGLFDITGTMWQWGTDGDPDNPRPSFFGGSWLHGGDAGSRFATLVDWPEHSCEGVGARGASDHLSLA